VSCVVMCVTRYDSTAVVRGITFRTKVNISAEFHKIKYQFVALYFVYVVRCYLMDFAYSCLVEPDVLEVVNSSCLLGICRLNLLHFPNNYLYITFTKFNTIIEFCECYIVVRKMYNVESLQSAIRRCDHLV